MSKSFERIPHLDLPLATHARRGARLVAPAHLEKASLYILVEVVQDYSEPVLICSDRCLLHRDLI